MIRSCCRQSCVTRCGECGESALPVRNWCLRRVCCRSTDSATGAPSVFLLRPSPCPHAVALGNSSTEMWSICLGVLFESPSLRHPSIGFSAAKSFRERIHVKKCSARRRERIFRSAQHCCTTAFELLPTFGCCPCCRSLT